MMKIVQHVLVCVSILNIVSGNSDTKNESENGIATQDEFPYEVSIHFTFSNEEFLCGGVIVSNTTILTSAQCMYYDFGGQIPPLVVRIKVGRSSLNEKARETYEVDKILLHPKFDKMAMYYNLALLKVKHQLDTNSLTNGSLIEYIPSASSGSNLSKNCSVVGWNKDAGDLRVLYVDIVNCNATNSKLICVKSSEDNDILCKMSLGSSLICNNQLAGILSVPTHCNSSLTYSIFENVFLNDPWLERNEAAVHRISFTLVTISLYMAFQQLLTS